MLRCAARALVVFLLLVASSRLSPAAAAAPAPAAATVREAVKTHLAANEVAVAAFLDGRLPFLGIPEVVEGTLNATDTAAARDLDELVAMDREARRTASALTRELVH